MIQPALHDLAVFAASYTVPPKEEALSARLRTTMLDWGSAAIAGTGHNLLPSYKDALLSGAGTGNSRVIGSSKRYPTTAAAMMNAAISHFWEIDDSHRSASAHPGVGVIPAVLAIAEARGLDAATTAAAIVAGYEVTLRIGSFLGSAHCAVNHTTATAGTMGAVAGAARALGATPQQMLWALGHAGTQAAGLWAFHDDQATAAKAFHAAMAVRNGLDAARLAMSGVPGATRILEGPRGMLAAWHLQNTDSAWLIPDAAHPMIHTVTVKNWPVCGQMHSALDSARTLAERHPELAQSDVPVTVDVPSIALDIAGIVQPRTVLEAKFSTQFCVAATLCGKAPTLTGLTQALVDDPEVRARMRSVAVRPDAAFTSRYPKDRPARITLHASCGDLTEQRDHRVGDHESPWSADAMNQRTAEALSLTPLETNLPALICWAEGLAAQDPDWNAGDVFDCLSALKVMKRKFPVHAPS